MVRVSVPNAAIGESTPLSYVLFPGRHHVLTRFQAQYLADLLGGWMSDTEGKLLEFSEDAAVVWAITSANHQNTRRNPIPAHRREAAIELFSGREGLRSLVVPVTDVPPTARFAEITIKAVEYGTGGRIDLDPRTTVVACSTPSVAELYAALGYRIAAVEHDHPQVPAYPWALLDKIAAGDETWRRDAHPASVDLITRYALDDHVRTLAADPMVSSEGSLTETRDYRSYGASFEAAARRKWDQARPFVQPGRIVDIGCATGGMIEIASHDHQLAESDLIGIEVARHLFEECEHKKAQGVFGNPNTFFYQRNVLSGALFPPRTIDTTLTFALTHEIYSYGERLADLRRFVATIAEQTAPGGVWINSDVCGPADPDRLVRLTFAEPGLDTAAVDLDRRTTEEIGSLLGARPPAGRFSQFVQDFRRNAQVDFPCTVVNDRTAELRLGDAMEFMTRFSYTSNWLSETHEQFCHLNWDGWVNLVQDCGLVVDRRSGAWRNEWLVDNVFRPAAELTTPDGQPLDWPDTHLLLVASPSLEAG